ncbi:hypothetical protein BKA70DRAFT_1264914 [Coprinopsis sp. MPI-PUGE-AT-0042]|nr:hypothetical protein BKA70DRAFT_1264914 [Coprinopsis sp. MPI-PUGE-AT-0042]
MMNGRGTGLRPLIYLALCHRAPQGSLEDVPLHSFPVPLLHPVLGSPHTRRMSGAAAAFKDLVAVNFGPVILGVFINTYLYGIGTFQYASYLTTQFKDPLWIKTTVLSLFVLDTFHSSSLVWMAWVYAVEGIVDYRKLLSPIWPYPFTIVATALVAFLTQFFLSYRTYRLTKAKWLFVASIISQLGTLCLGLVCSVKAWAVTSPLQLSSLKPFLTAWLIAETFIDLVICGLLLFVFSRSQTGFAGSDTVVRRLMRGAVQTGCFAGVFAVITLVLFLTRSDTQLFSATGIPISRLYSITLMDTILCRGELRDLVRQSESHNTTTTFGMGSLGPTTSAALHIHKEVEVHTDVRYSANVEAFQLRSSGRPKRLSTRPGGHVPRPSVDSNVLPSPTSSYFKVLEE